MTQTPTAPLTKCVKTAFGKKVFLLGRFKDGYTFWLEEPTWDCGWYWGFGYVETYTNKEGPPAKDIEAHRHYDGLFSGKHESYDFEKRACVLGHEWKHKISDNPDVAECVLNDKEQWLLADLMKMAYTLKKTAELYHHGNAYLTTHNMTPGCKREDLAKEINERQLPEIFKAIESILVSGTVE